MKKGLRNIDVKKDGIILQYSNGESYFIDTYYISEFWQKFGGSFMQAIGVALSRADSINTIKILECFKGKILEENKHLLQYYIENE